MSVLLKHQRANRIYVAGAMTGKSNYNFDAFNEAAAELYKSGWDVENPASTGVVEGATWQDYMLSCLTQIGICGNMYMLTGWESSRGANIEHDLASKLGLNIIYQDESYYK